MYFEGALINSQFFPDTESWRQVVTGCLRYFQWVKRSPSE
jgi:hypothetical protein